MAFSNEIADYTRLLAQGEPEWTKRMAGIRARLDRDPTYIMIKEAQKLIIELDRELDALGPLGLTQEEKDAFLQKAIDTVQPYYDRKSAEIEKGIQEGQVRSAEDILLYTRDVQNELTELLSGLDLKQAQTEEEFLNKVSDITSTRDENVQAKREEWRLRLEGLKLNQIQSGIFSSGIGKKKREEAKRLEGFEVGTIESRAARSETEAETARKYTLEQIRLAREAAERDRAAKIGAPTTQQALETLGLEDISQLGPKTAIEQSRMAEGRNVPIYQPTALSNLEEERLKAVESRKLEFQNEELALREQEYERKRQKILADKAAAQSRVGGYGSTGILFR